MKKQLMLLAITIMALGACKKQDNLSPVQPLKEGDIKKVASARDGHFDLLGYGYDVTGDYAVSSSARAKIFDVKALIAAYPLRVDSDFSHTSTPELFTGATAYDYSQKLSNSLTLTSSYVIFKGSLRAAFTDTSAFNSKFIYAQYNLYIQRKRFYVNATTAILKNYLSSAFLADIQTESPAYIVQHYGTHVLTDVKLGGRLSVFYQGQTTNTSRYSAANIGLSFSTKFVDSIKLGDTISNSTLERNKNFAQTLNITTHGGDPSIAIATTIPVDGYTGPQINVVNWQASVTDANSELVGFDKDGLIKISDLVDDPAKQAALSSYIDQYLIANQVSLAPAPVYEYYNVPQAKHAYNLNPQMNLSIPSYGMNGQPFRGFTTPYLGAVPVYQFINPSNGDHVLTTNRYPGWVGFNYDGIIFYAYSYHATGTVPCYEFYSSSTNDHMYSTNINPAAPYFYYNGTPFYVYSN